MHISNKQIDTICKLINIDRSDIMYKYDDTKNHPYLDGNVIFINSINDWREIYQFAHEALHFSFFQHTNGTTTEDVAWIEEVVCEAFSIYCVELLCQTERNYWLGYRERDLYIRYCGIKGPKHICNLKHLNEELRGYKSKELLQYIHPCALDIYHIIDSNLKELDRFFNYMQFVKDNKIIRSQDSTITLPLYDLQEAAENGLFYEKK